jgi:hypothetical protein
LPTTKVKIADTHDTTGEFVFTREALEYAASLAKNHRVPVTDGFYKGRLPIAYARNIRVSGDSLYADVNSEIAERQAETKFCFRVGGQLLSYTTPPSGGLRSVTKFRLLEVSIVPLAEATKTRSNVKCQCGNVGTVRRDSGLTAGIFCDPCWVQYVKRFHQGK